MAQTLTVEERLAALEKMVGEIALSLSQKNPPQKNWRSTIGMFAGDPVMKAIQEEGRKIREADRDQSRTQ